MMSKATIIIQKRAKMSYKKILGEIKEHKRSGINISETDSELKITIETKDITALRASLNAIIRDVQVIEGANTPK